MANTNFKEFTQKQIGNAFRNKNTTGIVSPAKFEVRISGIGSTRDMVLSCDTAYIPGLNFMTKEARTYGPLWEVPYAKTFDNLEITFILDRSFQQRYFFEEWYHRIIDFETNNANYFSDVVRDVDILQYDQTDQLIYHVTLLNAFPKRLDMIPLNWASFDEFQKVSINFVFENIVVKKDTKTYIKDYDHFNKDPFSQISTQE